MAIETQGHGLVLYSAPVRIVNLIYFTGAHPVSRLRLIRSGYLCHDSFDPDPTAYWNHTLGTDRSRGGWGEV